MATILFLAILIVGLIAYGTLAQGAVRYTMQANQYIYDLGKAAPTIIDTWAKENGYQVKVAERKTRYWSKFPNWLIASINIKAKSGYLGPYIGKVGVGHYVYRVVVTRIGEEKRRVAWIRVGRNVWGMTPESEDFKVIWEDEWRPQEPSVM